MSERVKMYVRCEHGMIEDHWAGCRHRGPGGRHHLNCPDGDVGHCGAKQLTPAEVLSVLLPDVDWEALRGELSDREIAISENPWLETRTEKVVRRLLAVYDGKDEG